MPISIVGTGSITGLSAGGLPDNSIVTADIADSAVTTGKLAQPLTLATAQNSTSGTSISFTSIPSWVRRITVNFSGVSTSGTSGVDVKLGTISGIESTGYSTGAIRCSVSGLAATGATTAFLINSIASSTDTLSGSMVINNVSGNTWVASGYFGGSGNTNFMFISAGNKTLSATLDRVSISSNNGTDTFDAGSINIMYEG